MAAALPVMGASPRITEGLRQHTAEALNFFPSLFNKILEVDKDLAYALVEPGVTYKQLHDYIAEHNLGLWLSVPAPSAIAGPTGNTLDRGVGYTPYGEHFMFACGMEVVLANGEVLRTGMGSLPSSNTWQVFKWGYGPYLDGIFTQSNYGIVTKLGFWLMPAPPVYKPFTVQYQNEDDIVDIVETIRPLRIGNVIPNAAVIAHALYDAPTKAKRSDYFTGAGSHSRRRGTQDYQGSQPRHLECLRGPVRHAGAG